MRGDVVPELRLYDARVAVRAGDAPPDDAHLGAVDLALGAVDERNALAEVELGVLLRSDTLDLDERGVRAGVALAALVAQDPAF